jgi:TolB-like protein
LSEPTTTAAVFLSYAREDSDAARRIADALRGFSVEVWFDQSELRGGEAWDQKIRGQIRTCSLLIPIVSAHAQGRGEGYFRREWKLAAERTHDMAAGIPFLVPVVIDDTLESAALVPDEFMSVQWTRLAQGRVTPQFVAQIKRLLEAPRAATPTRPAFPVAAPAEKTSTPAPAAPPSKSPLFAVGAIAVLAIAAAVFFALRPATKETPSVADAKSAAPSPSSLPPPTSRLPEVNAKSIAVLPFANMSPDKDNEFFAEGVHEDVITNLAKIRDLKVISRTSVLAYRDPASRNLKRIAAELGVATVLEGSVRRVGTKVRVTAQLIDARTDEHLWAETYDRDLTDVFTIQSALSQEIANALKANLTPGERTLIAMRLTRNPEAYDLYLRARTTFESTNPNAENVTRTIALYEQAVAKDPAFAAAFAQLAYLNGRMYWYAHMDPTPARRARTKAALDAALRLAPDSPDTRLALGAYAYYCDNDWSRALTEYRAAEAGLPNDAQLIYLIGLSYRRLGRLPEMASYLSRSLEINPRDFLCAGQLAQTLTSLRRYPAMRELIQRSLAFFPNELTLRRLLATAQLELDHDPAAHFHTMEAMVGDPGSVSSIEPNYTYLPYYLAMLRGDLAAADRSLIDPPRKTMPGYLSVINDPIARHRALVAWLRGQRSEARVLADEAITYYRAQSWTPRQTGAVMVGTALSHALAGRGDEAVKLASEAYTWQLAHDTYDATTLLTVVAQVYLVLDRRDDALHTLREMMTGPCSIGPERIRLDPLWARVKDDPRFEEILKSAKPL